MAGPAALQPLRFERQFVEKPWGGRSLASRPGIALPPGGQVGETWELVDRPKENSVVAEGAAPGRTLRSLLEEHGVAILGRARRSPGGEFPLLVKFIDACEDLSVQVHPHDGIASTLPRGDAPKTECWYILSAAPLSVVYLGLKPGVDAAELRRRSSDRSIVELLEMHPVREGDFVFVPAGTVHAIGAGIALAEVQETSDTTYRIYDWGRVDKDGRARPVHLDQALAATRFDVGTRGPIRPRAAAFAPGVRRAPLVDCASFAVELLELDGPQAGDAGARYEDSTDGVALVYVVVAGGGTLQGAGDKRYTLRAGDTWLVPASCSSPVIEARQPLRLLRARTKE
jgi:mannose-6-phosphate isomerase